MEELIKIEWDNDDGDSDSLSGQIEIETENEIWCLSAFIAVVHPPEKRLLYTVDVPDGLGGIRSLGAGFARSIEEAKTAIVEATNRIIDGLKVIEN